MRTILVVAAHSDDEALGCGGAIARHVAEGDSVHVVFLADGVRARKAADTEQELLRNSAAQNAASILGIESTRFLRFPDNRLDSLPLIDVVQQLEACIEELQPTVIYTHHGGDLNVDHRVAHEAVMTACRPIPQCTVREIYAFEVVSSTEWASSSHAPFVPNVYVDISVYLSTKLKALDAYQLEMRESPHSRSKDHIVSLAKHRGSCVGVLAAEAFVLTRMIR